MRGGASAGEVGRKSRWHRFGAETKQRKSSDFDSEIGNGDLGRE